jgi:cyclic di-GMP phosphodiesterase
MDHVLIVEDEAPVRRLVHRWVEGAGLPVLEAESAEQGLLLAGQHPPAVVLCDIHLPRGRHGFWLVEQLRRMRPETAVVMATGVHEFDAAVMSLRAGVSDYVVKPLTREVVLTAIRRAIEEHQARYAQSGESAADDEENAVSRRRALLAVLHAEDESAARHAERVSQVAVSLGRALRVTEPTLSDVDHAAMLREITRTDVHAISRNVPYLAAAAEIAVAVEERFDGRGFPRGLRGDAIPIGARVIAVADAYVRLAKSEHGLQLPPQVAADTLSRKDTGRFDPAVLQALSNAFVGGSPQGDAAECPR